jgi:hypothetical protein
MFSPDLPAVVMEAIQPSDTVSGILQCTLLIVFNLEALPCRKVLKHEFIAYCRFVFSFYTLRKRMLEIIGESVLGRYVPLSTADFT